MAFGTGHHATTQGCLTLLDGLDRLGLKARRVADIGCGTGVLAMAAAQIWRVAVVASDIDTVAVATARANARANRLHPWIVCVEAPGFRHPLIRARAPYDLVMANILAGPLKRMAPDIAAHLVPGGMAILSGILTRQAAGVEAVFASHGLVRERLCEIGEWTSFLLRRV